MTREEAGEFVTALIKVIETRAVAKITNDWFLAEMAREDLIDLLTEPEDTFGL
ncbi:hypothetical protein [Mesorhizobium sp.]|uniref:hypothetical protein n=1 Tax=Mesorhizobium sp. TaxID=1871066 RepID=UPI0025C0B011|nr:hypothetical protein [Mesorhizobium sp.]